MAFISPIPTDSRGVERQTGSLQQLGKDDFLQLLVTKLQHQDPLKPMDDEDFIAQLAQFSTLEQMNNIANGIAASNQWDFLQMQSLNNVMATGLIGKDVKATYNTVYADQDNTPKISYTLGSFAEEVEFVIRDAQGSVVATLTQDSVGEGTHFIEWDGTDSFGNRVDESLYTVEVTATDMSGSTFTPSLSLVGKVESVVYRDGAAFLTVNGTEIPLGDVTAIGEPGAYTGGEDDSGDDD